MVDPNHCSSFIKNLALAVATVLAFWTPLFSCYNHDLEKCLAMPKPPMHGKLTFAGGRLLGSIKCPEGTDLPLNAPGNGGVMLCAPDPRDESDSFEDFEVPKCLPYKKPDGLVLQVTATYTLPACPKSKTETSSLVTEVITELKDKVVPRPCLLGIECRTELDYSDCAKNFNFQKKGQEMQHDFVVNVRSSSYNPVIPLESYIKAADKIKGQLKMFNLSLPGMTFTSLGITHAWKASCESQKGTIGTELDYHKMASCRGCPINFFKPNNDSGCFPCEPMTYTKMKPFATECVTCPDKDKWKSTKSFNINCRHELLN